MHNCATFTAAVYINKARIGSKHPPRCSQPLFTTVNTIVRRGGKLM
jgi:hypothetical protein